MKVRCQGPNQDSRSFLQATNSPDNPILLTYDLLALLYYLCLKSGPKSVG